MVEALGKPLRETLGRHDDDHDRDDGDHGDGDARDDDASATVLVLLGIKS